ncbi:28S rRNA (cytosine-C(5))-methyltransferase-like isoform X2 [Anopheles albimanus]|uniref:28S rRNA (cytosine-C(5))-methyltransferase-like isoform X2 n=1 Tax=Anopheles albimanus TaxID=7167 RepID=UPI00163FA470|nr:28S rRNA (cytosine-C(5))-methyltransferase-like isoform X2 [Anopheles albimanus]
MPADARVATARKIPVPNNYRYAAKLLRLVTEEKKSVKTLLRDEKHFRAGRTIMDRLLVNLPQINAIIAHIDLTTKEPRLNPWMARALISELLYGRGELLGASLPVECVRRYEAEIRKAYEATKASIPAVKKFEEPRFVRVNTELLNLEGAKRLMQEEGWILVDEEFPDYQAFLHRVQNLTDSEYMVDFHFNDLLVFPHCSKAYWARAEHLFSKFFLQNKACLVPTYLLKPPKKSVVLDMCSAPGMKATHLANLMKNKGRIYAVERNAERYKLLCQYAAPFGVIKTIHADCLDLTDEQVPGVEYILLDPSCSGSGMLDRLRMPEPVDEGRLYKLAGLQYKLLSHAMNAFPNVRRIVYSTCSIHPEENEKVVMGVLRHNSHFRLLDARTELGKEWLNLGSPDYPGVGERCLYARSEIDLTIGMFVAVFERCEDGEENEIYSAHEQQKESYAKLAAIGSEGRKGRKHRGGNNFKPVEDGPEMQQRDGFGQGAEGQHTSAEEDKSTASGVLEEPSASVSKKKSKRKAEPEHTEPAVEESSANGVIEEPSASVSKKKSKRKAEPEHTEPAVEESSANGVLEEPSASVSKKKSKRKAEPEHTEPAVEESSANGVLEEPSASVSKKKSKRKAEPEHTEPAVEESSANGVLEEPSASVSKKKSKRKAVSLEQ